MTFFLIRKTQPTPLLFVKNNLLKMFRWLCQWGSLTKASGVNITFPIAFTSTVYSLSAGAGDEEDFSSSGIMLYNVTRTGFRINTRQSTPRYFIATGK